MTKNRITSTGSIKGLREIYESIGFFKDLTHRGTDIIMCSRGNLETKIQGTYKSGVTHEITRPDVLVGDFYLNEMRTNYPHWKCFIEDKPQPDPTDFRFGDIGVFFDPVDATKLLIEGRKGYSTMVGVSIFEEEGFIPILGMFDIVEGEFVWGYVDESKREGNVSGFLKTPQRDNLVLGRTSIERKGLLNPITNGLGYEVKYVRGMAPQVMSLLSGDTDLFIYEPGISLSDVFPVTPIIRASGGNVFDLKGRKITYKGDDNDTGKITVQSRRIEIDKGVLGIRDNNQRDEILEKIANSVSI